MVDRSLGLCNECRARVPAEFHFHDGQVWIRKSCPDCGETESLVSSDADAWRGKRETWSDLPVATGKCTLNCDRCRVDHNPTTVFLDVTNRCNMRCPICIATIHGMGFDFNPPLEYFEKVFAALARMRPRPVVQLFGGEPTVRNDLLEIIQIGRKHGLHPHVTTNGVRLADEAYCRKLCEAGVPLRFAFDGHSREIYERLRNNGPAYDKKLKGLENLRKHSRRKHTMIACAARGVNDRHMADLIQYCHDNRQLVSDLGIIPLTENWEDGQFDISTHTTLEDVEEIVRRSVAGGGVEFIPAGLTHWLGVPRPFFRDNPRSEILLLAGVHPNCESVTFLISDGETYHGINHYIKRPLGEAAREFADLVKKIEPKLARLDPKKRLERLRGQLLCITTLAPFIVRLVDFRRAFGGNPIVGLLKSAVRAWKRKRIKRITKRSTPAPYLRVAVLPFEEQHSIDADRLKSCKAAFAYEDAESGEIRTIPACLWGPYRNGILEKIAAKYGGASDDSQSAASREKAA